MLRMLLPDGELQLGMEDYKSKSATAIGISYAGEKYKFKFSKSGDATGFGISYDF